MEAEGDCWAGLELVKELREDGWGVRSTDLVKEDAKARGVGAPLATKRWREGEARLGAGGAVNANEEIT